jgi:hypothetical protein
MKANVFVDEAVKVKKGQDSDGRHLPKLQRESLEIGEKRLSILGVVFLTVITNAILL